MHDDSFNPSARPPGAGSPEGRREGGARTEGRGGGPGVPPGFDVDVLERSATEKDGQPQAMDRRLFMQLLVFDCSADPAETLDAVAAALSEGAVASVLYEDANDPRGIAVLTWSEDPAHFVTAVRPALNREELRSSLTLRPEMTMIGRTYSTGYEPDLEYWMLRRPPETVSNPDWPWAVWYPLRRNGEFAKLEPRQQAKILKEHAIIGRAYGARDLAHDVRLACHGLDVADNEFVIGLIGARLHPLSHVVQTMRKTKQTSTYIEKMGPFFVGRVARRTAG
jgi:chlorite dismutase